MRPSAPPRPIDTPCVALCAVDPQSGLCFGCFRSLKEIAAWSRFTDAEREALMRELPGRRALIAPEKLG